MRWFSGFGLLTGLLLMSLSVFGQSGQPQVGLITDALRAGKFADALRLLEPAVQQSPANPQLWTLQGLAYSGEGRKQQALSSFQHALKISPDYLPALEGAAQIEYQTGAPGAEALLVHVLKLVPADSTAHAMLASIAYRKHNCAIAVSHYEHSGAQLDSEPLALRQYGICLGKMKRHEDAITVFAKLVDQPGSDQFDRRRLAELQLSDGKSADAVQTLQPVLQDHPDSSVLALAAGAYEEEKNTPEAVKLLHQAIVEDPNNIDLYLQFADLSFVHQSFQVGIDMVSAGLKSQPKSGALYVARGILYVQLADYDHAEADFEKADKFDPKLTVSEVAKGMVAEQKEDLDKALAVVRARLSKAPNDALLLYVQADILVQKNPDIGTPDFNLAVASAQKAVKIQPDLVPARDTLAKLYLQADKNQLAVEESRQALQHDPNDQVGLYHLIVGLRRTGHKEDLPPLLQRLADLRQKATREEGEHNRYKLIEQSESGGISKP